MGLVHLSTVKCNQGIDFGHITLSRDTLRFGDTLNVSLSIINYDSSDFNGLIDFGISINGIQNLSRNILPNPLYDSLVIIPHGDSISTLIHIIITPAYFEAGPDIFVVWPIITNNDAFSQLPHQIYVLDPTEIIPIPGSGDLKIIQSNGIVSLKNEGQNVLKRVRLFNISGQLVYDRSYQNNMAIDIGRFGSGLYFMEVQFADNREQIIKLANF